MRPMKQETATIPADRPTRPTRFSSAKQSNSDRDNRENACNNAPTGVDRKTVPVSRLPIRSTDIYQNEGEFNAGRPTKNLHETCDQVRMQLEERIMSLELLNDRLQAEVDEHRRVNIELLKTCQGLRYAQKSQ